MRAMTNTMTRTRFAPSPTGLLHLGNVRTALFSALLARSRRGHFLLRIEDTDAERSRPEFVEALQRDLRWLGLDWDEGFGAGGDAGPYAQSERGELYAGYYRQLIDQGLAYPCFCSPAELERGRKRMRAQGKPPRYPGTCAHLSADEVARRESEGQKPTLRFRVPLGRTIRFEDGVRGPVSFRTDEIGDFVIRRSDGTPAFFFSNAIDDALMGVTDVVRGEDHIANTPRQMLLLEALGLEVPAYHHLPLVMGQDGAPLSKRNGSASVEELRADGYLPLAILNHLARLGHRFESDELLSSEALAAGFSPERIGHSAARHDPQQLEHWQSEALRGLPDEALQAYLEAAGVLDGVAAGERPALARLLRDNISRAAEAPVWVAAFADDPMPYSDSARDELVGAGSEFYGAALAALDDAGDFPALAKAVGAATGAKGRKLFMPLRAALSGQTYGPELPRIWEYLGRERVRARLRAAQEIAAAG
ncbi:MULTISPECIES: glutamate--tRNA ligase [unclassified Thioalkalivibrio]|uniref:glutamate--tRNA ligase n=1 Tax=unclassified Thioalkalivibrio TaxID=2621013 RepID=UPI000364CC2F|nr:MULTISPECIES: glutamate--tRNA ligase [unclassified Thioalkalivibrio]